MAALIFFGKNNFPDFYKHYVGPFFGGKIGFFMEIFVDEFGFFAIFFGFSMEVISQWAYDLLTAHAVPRIFLCSKSNIPRGYFGVKIAQLDV